MATYSKLKLSGSTSGKPIKVAATAIGSGTTIHTAVSGSTDYDEITLFVTNTSGAAVTITLGWGGTTDPDDLVSKAVSVPANSGPIPIVVGLLLNGGLIVRAAAGTADVLLISGYVNRINN
jgi:hypothetical protein